MAIASSKNFRHREGELLLKDALSIFLDNPNKYLEDNEHESDYYGARYINNEIDSLDVYYLVYKDTIDDKNSHR